MVKQMPGYEEQKIKTDKSEQEKKAEKLKKAQEKVQNKKINIVAKQAGISSTDEFFKMLFCAQAAFFIFGSLGYVSSRYNWVNEFNGDTEYFITEGIYGRDMSYGQAIKNAYLLEDWRNGKGGVFQGICGMLSILISLWIAGLVASGKRAKDAEKILSELEKLKEYGVDMNQLNEDLKPTMNKILKSLSAIDRDYFDNLANGGLDKATYETCVAIVAGYLKAHPKEYNQVITVIDEATLPEEIKKKYGKGKTISFAAAQALKPERNN